MKKDVSLYGLLINKKDFTEKEFNKAYDSLKTFVALSGKGKRRERILSTSWYNVRRSGAVLRNLRYDFEKDKAYYICAQDWNYEMASLRNAFDQWKRQ